MKAVTRDDRRIECDDVEEQAHGVVLYDGRGGRVGYVPYDNLRYVAELRTPVASSSIRSVGYEDEESALEIEFQSGGVYRYADVPDEVYRGLLSASSHGRYFHDEIRGEYEYRRLL